MLLNRVSDNHLVAPKQIETALGYGIHHTFPSDYRTVSTALNSGVPLTMTNHSEIASDFDNFTRQLVGLALESQARTRAPPRVPRRLLGTDMIATTAATSVAPRPGYLELKANVHRKLLNRLNLEALASADRSRAESEIRTLLFELIAEEGTPLSMSERESFLADIIDEVFGLGPLEPLLRDPGVSDILVNTYKNVYVEKQGKLERLPTTFQDDRHLMRVIDRIVSGVGRRVDDSSPMVDARLRGRLARQRDHPAARGGRSAALDPRAFPRSGSRPRT